MPIDISQMRFDKVAHESACDLVMKGGVTSGVVYPFAILKLAEKYRFRCIGGASAGAIAAAFTAAAEFARRNGDPEGFHRLAERCAALPNILESLFQPAPALRPLLKLLKAATGKGGAGKKIWSVAQAYPATIGFGALGTAGLLWLLLGPGAAILGAIVGAIAAPIVHTLMKLGSPLRQNRFGICSGMRAAAAAGPALTEWIHESLQYIAFGKLTRAPLTFGDLAAGPDPIELRMVTTNLSMRRPHFLPGFQTRIGYRPEEWKTLFPADVMEALAKLPRKPVRDDDDGNDDAVRMPEAEDLPVVVAVRMSLSFPFLLSAIPVWMPNRAEREIGDTLGVPRPSRIVPALLSDGGISSNFPVHFFDRVVPGRPTFAMSLDPLPAGMTDAPKRVHLPNNAGAGWALPAWPTETTAGFAMNILNAAKDWRDNLQSALPGFRERIVRVALDGDEGGLNLAMPPETTRRLMGYGAEAGDLLCTRFDLEEHRWRRALASYHALSVLGDGVTQTWSEVGPHVVAYIPKARSYGGLKTWALANLDAGFRAVMEAHSQTQTRLPAGARPFPRPRLRFRAGPETETE